ncbi:MAG TPA: hypothetical protein VFS00_15415 [Polyangiaceae bacterium]|nr:hypothetical protein [Polyangiaceae bacterium]
MAATARAPVTCPHYAPLPGERRCRHYLPNGACDRPDEFMCVEWLKKKGPSASTEAREGGKNADAATDATDAPRTAGRFSQRWLSLFDHAPPRLGPPPRPARAGATSPAPPSAAPPAASPASAEDVAALAERYAATKLETDDLGPVWLVAEPTGSDRLELTYRDAATLAAVCAAFPGARVVALERTKKKST